MYKVLAFFYFYLSPLLSENICQKNSDGKDSAKKLRTKNIDRPLGPEWYEYLEIVKLIILIQSR